MDGIQYHTNLKQNAKGLAKQKEGEKQRRSPSIFSKKAASQPNSPRREEEQENEFEETICPKFQDPNNSNRFHGQCLQHGQNLDGIQGQRGAKNETTPFPREIALSPCVVNNLRETKSSILTLKDIKNGLLSLKELNSSLLSIINISV
ncbi:hypothetical protein O181_129812 [Austropuccinia psidii MF-1]|uniref:Uncharacterized protein n=1 Tax=Austropuccinia psidii MF-1 TaxID=1389203 RepID=A0A9Q3KZY8_9BASI|nr:hypothetical protein [Austropuccinia psidii MF-1]